MAIGQIRRQLVACGWMLASIIGIAGVKLYFML
jgi:hypothetical protein